jgi:hypothetical protein
MNHAIFARMGAGTASVDPTVYRLKAHAFVGRRTYRLTDQALTWEEDGKSLDGVRYEDIAEVRLAYFPTRAATNRYRAQIIFRQGGMVQLFNTDYRGLLDFHEQNAEYVAFMTELHKHLAAQGNGIVYRLGNSPAAYVGNMILMVFIFAMIALSLFLFVAVGGGWLVVTKFVIVLAFVPVLIRYMRRAKPGIYDPAALPSTALPNLGTPA